MTSSSSTSSNSCLSDKDIQLLKNTYRKLTELYYENKKNQSLITDLISFSNLITQVIYSKKQSDTLSLISILEILKVKSKSQTELIRHIDTTIQHLKNPKFNPIKYENLLFALQKSELFEVGCTIAIRFYQKINSNTSQIDWKTVIGQLSKNISINPSLCIELLFYLCKENQLHSRVAVKEGLVKYIFLSYIAQTIEDKLNLYKSIKLLKAIATAQRTLLRDREKSFALIIYMYDAYIPVIEEICNKCYDSDYGQAIDAKRKFDQITIDQPYLWSYTQSFCSKNLSEQTIQQFVKSLLSPLNEERQTKTFGILSNYSKYRKIILKQALQTLPKNQRSLLNFIKLCLNCCQVDAMSISLINLNGLQQLVQKSSNPKVDQLYKYLKASRSKESKIGFLSDNIKKMFDMQKNADFMMQRASKIPQNNEQLEDIKQILKQKDRTNQFQSDTLRTVKERALSSLMTAILQKKKLDLNAILQQIDLSDVLMLSKLLQILELNIMINDDLIESVNVQRVIQIIQWIEDHYNGEIIEWGSIRQLLIILQQEDAWKQYLPTITQSCFWLLGIQQLNPQEQQSIFTKLNQITNNILKFQSKIPFLVGFLSKVLNKSNKLTLYSNYRPLFELMMKNLKTNVNYKSNSLSLSYFIKNWYSSDAKDIDNNDLFKSFIEPLVSVIINNFRSIQQQYEVLENALPYQFKYGFLNDNLDYLVGIYGKLASHVYKKSRQNGQNISLSYDRIKIIGHLGPEKSSNILQILIFLQDNSDILQEDELSIMLDNLISKKMAYWCVYPNFYNIVNKLLKIINKTTNPILIAVISSILYKLIVFIATTQDISEEEKSDLFNEIKHTLQLLSGKILIDKNKILKAIDKITDLQAKNQLLQVVNNYKNPVAVEVPPNVSPSKQKKQIVPQTITNASKSAQIEQILPINNDKAKVQQNWEDLQKNQDLMDLYQRLANLTDQQSKIMPGQITVIQALRQLKKIIQKTVPAQRFSVLKEVFLNSSLKGQETDILGHLLCKFYPMGLKKDQEQVLKLLLMKQKTQISKQSCYELLNKEKDAFVLSKRWKLTGHQWINLAVTRLTEGFYLEGSLVAEYNLLRSTDLEYFFFKKYHEATLSIFYKIKKPQDFVNYFVLIGTCSRFVQIKQYFLKDKLHLKILHLLPNYTENSKAIANIFYAISSLVYTQPQACLELVKQKTQMQNLLDIYKNHYQVKSIVQSGACLIANIAYSNQQIKEALNQMNVIEVILAVFQNSLENPQISTFKQLIRALGNLSMSKKLSMQLIDQHFCALSYEMVQKLDIFVSFDQKKASLMKNLIDLISNLATHRYELSVFHREKVTSFILTLLQTTQSHPSILTACIDTIDFLCQNSEIQNYVVTQKKFLYVLIDVLKTQSDEKIVVKSTRLLTNLTINQSCIPYILQANLLSVLANIVMPHFYGNKLATEQNKKMQTYIHKIITRIYLSKQSRDLILKSGYLDCLIRTIETTDNIQDAYIEILYNLSEYMPSFLNKRSFMCLIRVLTKKIQNKEVTNKCLRTFKNLSIFYQKDQADILIEGTSQMYEKLLTGQFKSEGLFLLTFHLLRSHKLRAQLQKKGDSVLQIVKKLSEEANYVDLSRLIYFIVYNPHSLLQQSELEPQQIHLNILKKGFKCNLFRMDGSCKKAIIDVNDQYSIRAYKYPDGEIKDKYMIDIKNLKDYQFNYPVSDQLWNSSLFSIEKGLFDSKKVNPKCCCTLVGNIRWGEVSFINVQFQSINDKLRFFQSLSQISNSLR